MRISDLVKSRGFKQFMAKLYGWGAAVVILGALFKILHLPGANEMLMIGMGTETIIFFFSAFEPPHVEPDWSLVYPELAGMYHGDDFAAELDEEDFIEGDEEVEEKPPLTEELTDMLAKADINQDLINKLGLGLSNLSESAANLNNMAAASEANNEFVSKLGKASVSVEKLSGNVEKSAQAVAAETAAAEAHINSLGTASQNASKLAEIYTGVSDALKRDMSATEAFNQSVNEATRSANALAENYTYSAEQLKAAASNLDFSDVDGAVYNEQLQKIAQNMEALNAAYELQLENSQAQITGSQQLQEMMKEYFNQMQASVEQTKEYQTQAQMLTKNVSALNNVYGNMLTAMNVKIS